MTAEQIRRLMALGAELSLTHAIYGPAGAKHGGFLDQTMPYYWFLAGLCRDEHIRTVLEVGTHFGGSTLAMLEGMRAGLPIEECAALALRLVTMDVERLNDELLSRYPEVVRIDGSSTDPVAVDAAVSELTSPHVDLLYIDALKSRDFVATSLALLGKRIVPRVIVLDDTAINESMRHMWREVCAWFGDAQVTQLSNLVPEVRDPQTGFGMVRVLPGRWPAELGHVARAEMDADRWQLGASKTWRADKLIEHLAYRAVVDEVKICHVGEVGQGELMALVRGVARAASQLAGAPAQIQALRVPPKTGWSEVARQAALLQCREASSLGVLLEGESFVESLSSERSGSLDLLVLSSQLTEAQWSHLVVTHLPRLQPGHSLLVVQDFGHPVLSGMDALVASLSPTFEVLAFAQPALVLGLRAPLPVDSLRRLLRSLVSEAARMAAVARWAQSDLPPEVEATLLVKLARRSVAKHRPLAPDVLAARLGALRAKCASPVLRGRIDKILSPVPAPPSAAAAISAEQPPLAD